MKVLVINSSPRPVEFSTTKCLSAHLVQGITEAGGEVDVINLDEKNIKMCTDCTSCATISEGKCVMQDDMTRDIFPKFLETDILVLATPVYFGMVNAAMKSFIERLFPYLEPYQNVHNGKVVQRFKGEIPKTIVISSASWHYSHVFDQISSYFQYLFEDKLIGEIYRGSSNAFLFGAMFGNKKEKILSEMNEAGKELVYIGKIENETIEKICQDVGELDKTVTMHNLSMELCQNSGLNTMQFAKQRVKDNEILIPNSTSTFIKLVELLYQEDKRENFSVQFVFKDKKKGKCFFKVDNGKLETNQSEKNDAQLTIKISFDNWIQVLYGTDDFNKLLMQGKVLVKGNCSVMNTMLRVLFPFKKISI